MVAIAIIGILAASAFFVLNPISQFQKANDAKRKSDLKQIQNALEVYYNDNGYYPSALSFGSALGTYMGKVPNDPNPAKTYAYSMALNGQAYYLYASLDRVDDPQACPGGSCESLETPTACVSDCNYGISSPNVNVFASAGEPTSPPAPTSAPTSGPTATPAPTSTPVPTSTPTPAPKLSPCSPYGDVDLDGWVSTNDSIMIANHLNLATLTEEQINNGNVKNDDGLTIIDSLYINQYLIGGIRDTFPVCPSP